jgi:hypothetical protein
MEYKKYNECVRNYNNFITKIEKGINNYETNHEKKLKDIQDSIDRINKVKPILKDYILKKLSMKLVQMGISSKVSDYPMEHIDYRKFNLKEEYNLIKQEKLELKKQEIKIDNSAEYAYEYYRSSGVIEAIINMATRKLSEVVVTEGFDRFWAYIEKRKLNKLEQKQKLINEKINADLQKLEDLNKALEQIVNIFSETSETYVPFLENKIEEINRLYMNDYKKIPSEILQQLHSSSKILKEITEKRIIPEGFTLVQADDVIKYKNTLSKEAKNFESIIENIAA